MPNLRRLLALWNLLLNRKAVEADLDEEVRSFYEITVQRLVAQGMPPDEARRAARLQFQSEDHVKEQVREARTGATLDALGRNLRYAFRSLRKSPVFSLVTILTLALGIASNTTIFSIVNRFVFHSAPVGNPATLMAVTTTHQGECCNNFSWPLYVDLRDQVRSFSDVAAYYELIPASINGQGEPQRVWGQAATANFFDVTQLPMTLGRGFAKDEQNAPVVVIGYGLWQQRFAADRDISGKTIKLSGHTFTVIGVAPPSFRGVDIILDCQFWVPLGLIDQLLPNTTNKISRDYHWINALGRLRPNVTRAEAVAELNTLAQRFSKIRPDAFDNGFRMDTAGSLPPRDKNAVLMFFGALTVVAFLVLCIACANVANLFLAHMAGRHREVSVRLAIGGTRRHLITQMLTESTLLSLAGGVVGVLLSTLGVRGLAAFRLPAPVPLDLQVGIDDKVLLYAFALSVIVGIVFGLAPAWSMLRTSIANGLRGEDLLARPGRIWSLRNVLVVVQIAMSVVLICATGLFLRSLQAASRINIGFHSNGILTMAVDPRLHGYSDRQTTQLLEELRYRVANLPGVVSATYTDSLPLSEGHRSDAFSVVGAQPSNASESTDLYMVGPEYFQTIGTSIVAGHDFINQDPNGVKVALVNQTFVRRLFKNENPIGRLITGRGVTYQVIGVVNDVKSRFLGEDYRPVLYRSLAQDIAGDPSVSGYRIVVRYAHDSPSVSAGIRQTIHTLDPNLAVFDVESMEEHLRDALFLPRLSSWLFGVFGVLGITLASVGLYGVMNAWVGQRTREIGIRLALGARASEIQWLIIRQGMLLTMVAILPGLGLAWGVSMMFASVLLGVNPHDKLTFIAVPLLLILVALIACWLPSRRTLGTEPLVALRHE